MALFKIGKGRPVINPHEIVREYRGVSIPCSKVLLFLTPRLFRTAARAAHEVKNVKFSAALFKTAVGRYDNEKVLLALPFWGAPAAVAGLELLIAGGGKSFIMVGEAGAVSPKLRVGDILIPSWGLREEGTSYHYMPPDFIPKPDAELAEALLSEVENVKGRRRIKVLRGGIWSTDAIFRETLDKVAEYSGNGVLGVDMEATALMSVAAYREVRLAVITAISDELYGDRWRPGFKSRRLRRAEEIVVEASMKAIRGSVD